MYGMGMLRLREMWAWAHVNWGIPIIKISSCACKHGRKCGATTQHKLVNKGENK